jgi:hypothetical protein
VAGRYERFSREAPAPLVTLCTVSTFRSAQHTGCHYTPMLGEVLWRASRSQRHLRCPSLRAQRAVVGQPCTCCGGSGGAGDGHGHGIGGARLAQAAAMVACLLKLAHTVVWRHQYVCSLRGAARARGGTCRAARVLRRIGAQVLVGRHGRRLSVVLQQRTSTAGLSARSMGPRSARVGSPSVELGRRPRLCGHVDGSGRR